jgi:hypothetical protein
VGILALQLSHRFQGLLAKATFSSSVAEPAMEYRRLGKAGIKVSALSFGTWMTFTEGDVHDRVKTCIDHGINFIDNAEGYSEGRAEEVKRLLRLILTWLRL